MPKHLNDCPSALRIEAFVLIDLESQARAVYRFTRGWSREQFIGWLARRGKLGTTLDQSAFHFMSYSGLSTTIFFTEGRRFIVFYPGGPTTGDPLRNEPDDDH